MKFSLSLALLALTVFSSANDTLYFYTQRSDCAGLSMIGSGGTNTCISAGSGPGPFYSVDKDDGDPNSNLYAYSDMGTCSDLIVQVPQTSCAAAPNGAAVVEAAIYDLLTPGKRDLADPQPGMLEFHSYGYTNGTTVFTINIDSPAGEAYKLLSSDDERVEHIIMHSQNTYPRRR